jgi:hypothetical protein
MEGADMAGFRTCFSYQFIKEPCVFHPMEGMIMHPYDEVLGFTSTNTDDILDLGAEISIELGAEREEYTFHETYMVCIPAGLPHGPVRVKNVSRPFVHFSIGLSTEYKAVKIPPAALKAPVPGGRYAGYAKLMVGTYDPVTSRKLTEEELKGPGRSKSLDSRGVRHPQWNQKAGFTGPGNADNLLWLYGADCLGLDVNFLFSHCSKPGIWHRAAESHAHPEEEILIMLGLDPDNPRELGASLEIAMGENDERHVCTVPTVYVMPKGFRHLPEITRWADKPYVFMVVTPDGSHDTPWQDSKGKGVEIRSH